MGSLFDDFFEGFETELEAYSPRMDVTENEKEFSVALELPGVSKKDVHLSLEKIVLSLKARKKKNTRKRKKAIATLNVPMVLSEGLLPLMPKSMKAT